MSPRMWFRPAGSRGAAALTLAMAISAFGALHVLILAGARIPYAMAKDGVFFQFARRLQPRFCSPSGALSFVGSVAILLALTGTFEELYSFFGALHVLILAGARIPYAMAKDGVFFQFARRLQPRFCSPSGALSFVGSVAILLALTGTFEELYSFFGALHVLILAGARIPYAMAKDGVFFQFARRLQPRFCSPSGALSFVGSVAILLALTGTFEELYSFFGALHVLILAGARI